MAEELEGRSKAKTGCGCPISSAHMVGSLGSGQVASLFVHPHPLTFLMVKGVGYSSSACQVGLPVFFLSLIPLTFLSVFTDPLALYNRDGL